MKEGFKPIFEREKERLEKKLARQESGLAETKKDLGEIQELLRSAP